LRRVGIHLSLHKILHRNLFIASPTKVLLVSNKQTGERRVTDADQTIEKSDAKSAFRAFLDFFVLFSGISTRSNLERTQRRPLSQKGVFLFRGRKKVNAPEPADEDTPR